MLTLQGISYSHPNHDVLLRNINLTINTSDKIALLGKNGSGKSTLLKIASGELRPGTGTVSSNALSWYVPQQFGQFNHFTVSEALGIDQKLKALNEILDGRATEQDMITLNDDWTLETRCREALRYWQLRHIDLNQKMEALSGGEKTKVLLAGMLIHQPELILLDEPSNHLDGSSRRLLYEFIQSTKQTLVVVSHDRELLNQVNTILELDDSGIRTYGGNYAFYAEQKQQEINALSMDINSKEKTLRKAREKERETNERQQKLDSRGKKKQAKAGVARIMMNTLRNQAENSTSKLKSVHTEKIASISHDLQNLRAKVPDMDRMKFGFAKTTLHPGKVLVELSQVNVLYKEEMLWRKSQSLKIKSGERIALRGDNGSGKTTLIKLLLGVITPTAGSVHRAEFNAVFVDQDYSMIDSTRTVLEQAQHVNTSGLPEHEIKIRLNRFLFGSDAWDKPCSALSGGERMRLMLCCITLGQRSPDMIILDEPTNNLDIQNVEILSAAINEYAGTLVVVSHDETFLKELNMSRGIELTRM